MADYELDLIELTAADIEKKLADMELLGASLFL